MVRRRVADVKASAVLQCKVALLQRRLQKKNEAVLKPPVGKRAVRNISAVGDLPAAGVGDIMEGTREKFVQNQPWLALYSHPGARLAQALSEGALTERNP